MNNRPGASYYETLTAAVNDMQEHGYDSEKRLNYWLYELAEAAERSLVPEHVLNEHIRNIFINKFDHLVNKGGMLKYHQGISKFGIEKIKPHLRAELDRRIMTSVNLIKLNREEMMQRTIRRFQGWATSIPIGGSDAQSKTEIKKSLKLSDMTFLERRVMIDQGHKLVSALNDIVAKDNNALAAIWHSHGHTDPSYNARKIHLQREGSIYAIRNNWAIEKGLMKKGPSGYLDDIDQPGEFVYCFPGDTSLDFAYGISKAYRRFFSGKLTVLKTIDGAELRATPNHPVLTQRGWIAIKDIKEGDYLIKVKDQRSDIPKVYENTRTSKFVDVFDALLAFGRPKKIQTNVLDFHGDGTDGYVDVIHTKRKLLFCGNSRLSQSVKNFYFSLSDDFGFTFSSIMQSIHGLFFPTKKRMGIFGQFKTLFSGKFRHANDIGAAAISYANAMIPNNSSHQSTTTPNGFGDCKNTIPGKIEINDGLLIIKKKFIFGDMIRVIISSIKSKFFSTRNKGSVLNAQNSSDFLDSHVLGTHFIKVININNDFLWSGHVYNLETSNSWYVANGFIVHNCRCYAQFIYSLNRLPDDMLTVAGKKAIGRFSINA